MAAAGAARALAARRRLAAACVAAARRARRTASARRDAGRAGDAGDAQAGARQRRRPRDGAGTGPDGRITTDDVARRAARVARPRRAGAEPATRGAERRARPVPRRAQEDRREHGALEADGGALHLRRGGRLSPTLVALRERAERASRRAQGVKLSFLPFIIKATVAGAEEVPAAERRARRGGRRDRPAAQLPHRAGRRDRRRADRSGGARRRPAVARRAGARDRAAGGRHPHGQGGRARSSPARPSPSPAWARFGGVLATPIINYPEVAILGVHQIIRRPASSRRQGWRQDRDPRPHEPLALVRSPRGRRLRRRALRRGHQGDAGDPGACPDDPLNRWPAPRTKRSRASARGWGTSPRRPSKCGSDEDYRRATGLLTSEAAGGAAGPRARDAARRLWGDAVRARAGRP